MLHGVWLSGWLLVLHYTELWGVYKQASERWVASHSVHLRTVSALLAHARLAATYRACLWSIRACTVTSPDSSHIQAMAARPHGCKNRAKYVSQRVSTLFPGEFRKLNNETLTLGMIVDDLSRRLFIATFVFH